MLLKLCVPCFLYLCAVFPLCLLWHLCQAVPVPAVVCASELCGFRF